jgi:DNA/RNA endonuclease YhcR with UshA esterase domain
MQNFKLKENRFITATIIKHKKALFVGLLIALIMIVAIIMVSSGGRSESLILNSNAPKSDMSAKPVGDGDYDYTEAVDHIGEKATVTGTVNNIFTSKSGTVFFDYCDNFETCPFSVVIFASDVSKFKDLQQYQREVKVIGVIKSYQGKAEIILNGPEQIE